MVRNKINKYDITKLSMEDLKKIATDELLIYIDEFKDKNEIIIYLIKIIQQNSLHSNKIVQYMKKFDKLKDLKNKLILIHKIIADNALFRNNDLVNDLREIAKALLNLRYTDLRKINNLEKEGKKLEKQVSLVLYNKVNREMGLLFVDICKLYEDKLHNEFIQEFSLKQLIKWCNGLKNTPLAVDIHFGETMDEKGKQLVNMSFAKDRESNIKKIEKFKRDTKKLKKEEGDN